MSKDRARFHSLDGWRGICALFVALLHIPIRDGFLGFSFFKDAYLLVDFFFVLSGFVLSHSYGISPECDSNSWLKFLVNRFARLWPLHVAIFGCFIILNLTKMTLYSWYDKASGPPPTILGLVITSLEQIFLLQALIPSPVGIAWNGPSWSISAEFWTYIIFMFLVIIYPRRWKYSVPLVLSSALIVIFVSKSGINVINWLGFFRCFYGFFLGHLIYRFYISTKTSKWKLKMHKLSSTITEFLCIFAVVLFLTVAKQSALSFLAPLFFAIVIYVFADEAGATSRILSGTVCQILGRYSYSIYMTFGLVISLSVGGCRLIEKMLHLHIIIATPVPGSKGDDYLIHFGATWEMVTLAGLILGSIVLVSHYTYRYIEVPSREFVKRLGGAFIRSRRIAPISSEFDRPKKY